MQIDSFPRDPDLGTKSWIRIQIQCIWIHNTDFDSLYYYVLEA